MQKGYTHFFGVKKQIGFQGVRILLETVKKTLQGEMNQKLQREKSNLTEKTKELRKYSLKLEDEILYRDSEIKKLRHSIFEHKKQLKRTFQSSNILQLVEPIMKKSENISDIVKNFIEYINVKHQYDLLVQKTSKVPFDFTVDEEGLNTTIEADKTVKFKANFIQINKKSIKVGENFLRLYYLADLPAEFGELVYFKLLSSPIPFELSLFVEPTPNGAILRQARRRISALEALQNQRENKGQIRDPEIDRNIYLTKIFADDITYERERAIVYSLYCCIKSDSESGLDLLEREFLNETESIELVFNTYSFGQEKAFRNLLPFDVDNIKEDRIVQSSAASLLMPFVTKSHYDPRGIFLGTNVYHNSVVFLNPFTPRNNNINIFGVSGAGKSVTSKIIASRMFMMGTQIVIIDPEGEYVKLAHKLGGEVIQFTRENGINPFFVYGKTEDEVLSHISTLKTFLKFFIPGNVYNSAVLDRILMTLYKTGKKQNFNELLKLLEGSSMKEYIKVLYEGSMQGIFTSERKLELENEFIVFDLSELKKDDNRAPAMFLLTSILWNLVNNTVDRKRMLFIDEAHMLLVDEEVAEFYRLLVKIARKRDLGVVSITQDVEDFLDNDFGKAIITNSETKILLKQSYATLGLMNMIYPMTDDEKISLGNMSKGEVMIFRESEHVGAYIQILPSEQELVLTQQAEISHEE